MSVDSDGEFSGAIDAMRLCVASSKTYQEVTASRNESQALGTVVRGGIWETSPPDQARAIVRMDEGMTVSGRENISSFVWTVPFLVSFEFPIPESHWSDFTDSYTWFMNRDGKIFKEMLNNTRERPGELPFVVEAYHTIRPGIYDPDEQQGNYIGVSEYTFEALGEISL